MLAIVALMMLSTMVASMVVWLLVYWWAKP